MGGNADSIRRYTQPAGFDSRMCILSAIGICFVVLGHLRTEGAAIATFFDWFPYYSFHMPLFLFITGYFFRDIIVWNRSDRVQGSAGGAGRSGKFVPSLLQFIWKKFRRLMIPYYIINGCLILLQMLLNGNHFYFYPYSFFDYLLMPWTQCQPYTFAIPTWYLAGLFIAEVYYVLLRSAVLAVVKKKHIAETVLLFLTLFLGVAACYIQYTLQPSECVMVYLRSVVMLFFIQAGRLYRSCLEKHDTLPSRWYFLILLILQFILLLICRGAKLNFGLYYLQGFGRTGFLYFCAGLTGIALWLRVSRLIDQIRKPGRLVLFVGQNTKYIMAFHLLGFFALNLLFLALHSQGVWPGFLGRFNPEELYADPFYYWYQQAGPRLIPIYFLAGMGMSLLLAKLIGLGKHRLQLLTRRNKAG